MDQDLERFICTFFQQSGAALETHDKMVEVLLPESLSKQLETDEYIHINRKPDSGSNTAHEITYGSVILEKILNTVCDRVPILACQLEFGYLKSQGFDKLIKECLSFSGSVGTVESHATISTDYIFFTCKYLAQSDEQKEGLLNLVFNLETGAHVPDMTHTLTSVAQAPEAKNVNPVQEEKKIEQILKWVEAHAEATISEEIGPFQESMTRRFHRDVANLEEYYSSLAAEMEKSLERPGISDQLIADRREKIDLIPDELERKKDDLFKKYSIDIKVDPCAVMLIRTPAIRLLYRAAIGRKIKNLSLTYNPVTKSVDPLVCQGCHVSTRQIYFCDGLHLLCPKCRHSCPVC